ncbi:MAG: YibE/F family protein [Peptococcaceae bacterium]|nr:YibE/F family protein [Peptococcaceae bacterium]
MKQLRLYLLNLIGTKRNYLALGVALVILAALAYNFVATNEGYYHKTIAKIIALTGQTAPDSEGNFTQQVDAVIMNGAHRGEQIKLHNYTSLAQANDEQLKVNDEVFVNLRFTTANQIKSATITNFKRDKYIVYIALVFSLLILFIGGLKGLRSMVSVVINGVIILLVIDLYLHGLNLILVASGASVLFIVLSILIVSGRNKKTLAAIVGTMAGTLLAMSITAGVIFMTKGKGIHYEEMEFLTTSPTAIFMAEILIGTLGAIMDIAISISAAVQEMYDNNPDIPTLALLNSGREIGQDIMGTMANTLVFAYLSGSIPMILLWLKNGFSIFYIIGVNINLEIIRALVGSIGIVISIPVTLLIAVLLLKQNKLEEAEDL